jgi:molecular chaperone GrpE (heat shock protein)
MMSSQPFSRRLGAAWGLLVGRTTPQPAAPPADSPADQARLAAESALASARIDLEQARKETEALRRTLDGERGGRQDAIDAAKAARLAPVMTDLAETLAQLALQRRLIEEGKPVAASDVAALAAGIAETLDRVGLAQLGAPGDRAAFDPALHQSLAGPPPAAGAPITVRMPGFRFGGQIVRRASVLSI